MEIFSPLLAICAGNSPVTGEFPTQRPVTRSFDVYFDLRPKERLSKQWWGWWFETLSRSLWRHRNAKVSKWVMGHGLFIVALTQAILLYLSRCLQTCVRVNDFGFVRRYATLLQTITLTSSINVTDASIDTHFESFSWVLFAAPVISFEGFCARGRYLRHA